MIKYKYSGEYSIYDNNETKQELINIKIDAGTFSPTYKIHTECKKEELDDLLKARYTRWIRIDCKKIFCIILVDKQINHY